MSEYNIFFAQGGGEDCEKILSAFCEAVPHAEVTLTKAEDEWNKSFGSCGSWDAWVTHVATGLDPDFRTPLYNAIAFGERNLRDGYAQIAREALGARRMVCFIEGEKVRRATKVEGEVLCD